MRMHGLVVMWRFVCHMNQTILSEAICEVEDAELKGRCCCASPFSQSSSISCCLPLHGSPTLILMCVTLRHFLIVVLGLVTQCSHLHSFIPSTQLHSAPSKHLITSQLIHDINHICVILHFLPPDYLLFF